LSRRLVQFWQNFQTSFILLIPNCTRHRMITYTNYSCWGKYYPICEVNSTLKMELKCWSKKYSQNRVNFFLLLYNLYNLYNLFFYFWSSIYSLKLTV
jgi:hypothetical protein